MLGENLLKLWFICCMFSMENIVFLAVVNLTVDGNTYMYG